MTIKEAIRHALRLGDVAPNFKAQSSAGEIDFYEFKKGKWAILFSHPGDFTPVCTAELALVGKLSKEWEKRHVAALGLSCDTLESHRQMIADILEIKGVVINYPIVADPERSIAAMYDMLDSKKTGKVDKQGYPLTVRSVFIIDPNNIVRVILYYPDTCGRNFDEILRIMDSLQLTDMFKVATPPNWRIGDDVLIHPEVQKAEADALFPR
ncbi:hypothetical protein HK099_006766, partial [Clydaea vesicula]